MEEKTQNWKHRSNLIQKDQNNQQHELQRKRERLNMHPKWYAYPVLGKMNLKLREIYTVYLNDSNTIMIIIIIMINTLVEDTQLTYSY